MVLELEVILNYGDSIYKEENMAICTKCGVILNDQDMSDHVCDPNDVPEVGKMMKTKTDKVDKE